MLSRYHELRKSYHEEKTHSKTQEQNPSEGLSFQKDVKNSHSGKKLTIDYDELVNDFVYDLKTSQLKPAEEKNLLNKLQRIIVMYNNSLCNLDKALDGNKKNIESYEKLIERLESEIKESREDRFRKATIIDKLVSDCRYLRNVIAEERSKFQTEKDKSSQDMNKFLSQFETEVEDVKIVMKQEMSKQIDKARSDFEREKVGELNHLNEVISHLKNEIISHKTQYDRSKGKEKDMEESLLEWKTNCNRLQNELETAQELLQQKDDNTSELQKLILEGQEKLERHRRDRDEELEKIEDKVKQIIKEKDEKIQCLMVRFHTEENKAKKLEEFIMKIENGLPKLQL